jgi:hypothetical protein
VESSDAESMEVYALEVGRSGVDEGLRDRYARAALAVTEPGGHGGLLLRRGARGDVLDLR